uniref:SF4 helicase domain-containing protein n=1 Tax=Musa acuminata subsp. malaccensis TaxID=214687 RepID=A0A804L712_MUSAM
MPSIPCGALQSLLMGGSKYIPVRYSAYAAAVAAFVPRRLLHFRVHLRSPHFRGPVYNNLPFCQISYRACNRSSVPVTAANAGFEVARPGDETIFAERIAHLKTKMKEVGIEYAACIPGKSPALLCPKCRGGSSTVKSLFVVIHEDRNLAIWTCFRGECGWKGEVQACEDVKAGLTEKDEDMNAKQHTVTTEKRLQLEPLGEEVIAYFADRMISAETLRRNAIKQIKCGKKIAIAFPYRRNGTLVSCKYRDFSKKFWQEPDKERIFYGLDDINQSSDVIIVEGEIDKLSMEEAGYRNCVSVPDGAPAQVSKGPLVAAEEDTKFQYLWNCKEYLEKASRIILATDADGPGQALAEELARRLGKERCLRVKWPEKSANEVCKDANEVLIHYGPDALKKVVENSELYPIRGLFQFSDFFHEVDAYYHQTHGFELGVSTGWRALDELYNVMPGELTVITGVPNSGKSEWIDALLCNINENDKWKFALCSMENKVREHARKLLEKHIRKPFFDASYGGSTERMTVQELEQGKKWLNDTFHLIRCEDDCLPSIKWVLRLAKAAVLRYGVRGLVIDPYNELDHQRPPNQTETEYVSQMLSMIKRFAQHYSCHVWFVAHPRQLQHWTGGPPNMYDISGSAHFINKCDNGIVIHRNRDAKVGPLDGVQVCVRKVRNKVVGTIGDAFLSYNRITGEFEDIDVRAISMSITRGG